MSNEHQTAVIEVAMQLERIGTPEMIAAGRKLRDAAVGFHREAREKNILQELFNDAHTSLADIEAAGWWLQTNQGGHYWWRNKDDRAVQSLPYWIVELFYKFRDDGKVARAKERAVALKAYQAAAGQIFGFRPPKLMKAIAAADRALPTDAPEVPKPETPTT